MKTRIANRLGETVSPKVIAKAESYVDHIRDTNLPTCWDVDGLGGRYRICIDSGQFSCTCPSDEHRLCSHVIAVWLRQYAAGTPVRIALIDGPSPVLVAADGSDPFAGLA